MLPWLLTFTLLSAAVALAVFLLARRRNAAGIQTSLTARTAAVGGLVSRSLRRRLALRARLLLARRHRRAEIEAAHHIQTASEAAALMGQMKGVFMKIGQIVSFTRDSLPEEARQALGALQQDAPPMAFHLVRDVVEGDLGAPLARHLRHIDEEPLAAASIGQVHRATALDGRPVALKVQYPGVDAAIRNDLRFSQGLATLIGSFHKNADPVAMVAELKARLEDELDYRVEADNQRLFHRLWDGHPVIRVPRVFDDLVGQHVLGQELAEGLAFADFLAAATADEKRLAAMAIHDFVFDSMHLHGVFNGDPHPGNYLFHPDGGVSFLDYGCVKRFDPAFLRDVRGLTIAQVDGDHARFDELVRRLAIVLPGRPLDHDFLWDFFGYHMAPFKEDREFAFDDAYLKEAAHVMQQKHLKKLNLPPDLIFFNRITFGLNAIFAAL
ncbi:MAG: AarF/ABC1/UbiB kinase family protein, partial [Myxococcales bacterium]|nr:AarF/ABC1/UbiB kinase family protein [Myxococcales bacterium]